MVFGSVAASMQIKSQRRSALCKRLPEQVNSAHD